MKTSKKRAQLSQEEYLLSIIVPVFNVRPFLDECIESILSQSTESIEIILVDDGSTDGSGARCDYYAESNSLVGVIHKPNGGLASARNAGLKVARGRYVSFIDSDDRIASASLSRVIEWIDRSEADICFLGCEKFYPDGSRKPFGCVILPNDVENKSGDEAVKALSYLDKFPDSACIKLYRRAFLESNGLNFPDDGRYGEDLGFAIDCFLAAQSFSAIEGPFYEYRQNRSGSISSSHGVKNFDDVSKFIEESIKKLTDGHRRPKNSRCESCLSFVAYMFSILVWMVGVLDKDEKRKGFERLNKLVWVMSFARGRKAVMTRAAIKVLGIKGASKLLSFYMRIR